MDSYYSFMKEIEEKKMYMDYWMLAVVILVVLIVILKSYQREPKETEKEKEARLLKERSADFVKVRDTLKSKKSKELFFSIYCQFDQQRFEELKNIKYGSKRVCYSPGYLSRSRETMRRIFALFNDDDKKTVYEFAKRWYPVEAYHLYYDQKKESERKSS